MRKCLLSSIFLLLFLFVSKHSSSQIDSCYIKKDSVYISTPQRNYKFNLKFPFPTYTGLIIKTNKNYVYFCNQRGCDICGCGFNFMKGELKDDSFITTDAYSYYYGECTSVSCKFQGNNLVFQQKLSRMDLKVSIGLDTISKENYTKTLDNLKMYLKSENAHRAPGSIK